MKCGMKGARLGKEVTEAERGAFLADLGYCDSSLAQRPADKDK